MNKMNLNLLYNLKFAIYLLSMSSPSKLFSCVESDAILHSPINQSSAKYNWTFSKDYRFKKPKL